MCGIVGYIGSRDVVEVLIGGLEKLEYRGYDSAGIAVFDNKNIRCVKQSGKVAAVKTKIEAEWPEYTGASSPGIAHTRWATHGPPTTENSHPHLDASGRFAIVHNGIVENYGALKSHLIGKGHSFASETDSEVIANLIAECYEGDLFKATAAALKQLEGTFGLAVISTTEPDLMIVARRGSAIAIGVGNNEVIVASDISALLAYTSRVIFLDDDDIALIRKDDIDIRDLNNVPVAREIAHIDWTPDSAEKGGYEHFMLKEINEQPNAVGNAIRGRIDLKRGSGIFSGLDLDPREMAAINRIVLPACGTSMHAAMVGEYYFEDMAGIPTQVEQAAEFRCRNPIIEPNTLVIPVSQSGETADTLTALREAAEKGALVAAICNVVGSSIAREAGRGIYLHAGPEISVASTKAFTCQTAVLLLMALKFARGRRMSCETGLEIAEEIARIPALIEETLKQADNIAKIAETFKDVKSCFYIGRGYLYPAALEGALKLKEISYIHAEGYHAAELKHGPIALLEETVPVIALANDIPGRDKVIGNIQECRARKSPVIVTATIGDDEIAALADEVIWIPPCSKYVAPILTVVALQVFSYYAAKTRGCEIDQPRNLAKSVTVE